MLSQDQREYYSMLWQLGDWQSLSLLSSDEYPEKTSCEQKLYSIAALYQLGHLEKADQLLRMLELTPEQKKLAVSLLISGAFNTLGKAYACTNNYEQAELLCKKSLTEVAEVDISHALVNARVSEQFSQLGIPRLSTNIVPAHFKPDAESFLKHSNKYFFHEPSIQIALAEYHQLNERYDSAIVHWQNVSSLLNAETPQLYYDRLKEAYKSIKGFPQGTVEQETLRGDTDKHQLLMEIHKQLQPEFYFEIGVQTGKSLVLANCEALGIDPMPMLSQELPATAKVLSISSDSFFMNRSDLLLRKSIDLAFIDGMHLFEYALRDFINVEKYAQPYSLIVIDDIFPGHPDQAKRERCTRAWTGDVWKLKEIFEKFRPDLFMLAIDVHPTGLLLISALDPESTILSENYQEILNEYVDDLPVPTRIITRENVLSGGSDSIFKMIGVLKDFREKNNSSENIKNSLATIG